MHNNPWKTTASAAFRTQRPTQAAQRYEPSRNRIIYLCRVTTEHICLTARTNELLTDRYQPLLKDNGISCQVLDSEGSAAIGKGIRLATMHRMKGLEFPRVIIAGLNSDTLPLKLGNHSFPDEASREDFVGPKLRLPSC